MLWMALLPILMQSYNIFVAAVCVLCACSRLVCVVARYLLTYACVCAFFFVYLQSL